MPNLIADEPPSLSTCALHGGQSLLPEAWGGLLGLWSPGVGHQGMSLAPLGVGKKAPFTGLDTSDYIADQPGLVLDFTTGAAEYADTNLTMASMAQYTSLVVWKRKASNAIVTVASSSPTTANVIQLTTAFSDGNVYVNPTIGGFGSYASNDTNWHITVSRFDGSQATNGTRMRAWHDGVEQPLSFTSTIATATSAIPGTISIGYRPNATLQSNGRIGTVMIWNRALEVSLIRRLTWNHMDMLRKRQPPVVGKRVITGLRRDRRRMSLSRGPREPVPFLQW